MRPSDISIAPEKIIIEIIKLAYPEGIVLSIILEIKKYIAEIKPRIDKETPIIKETLKGNIENPVDIFDQSSSNFIKV